MALDVTIKRAYDPPADTDGYRILIDHIWPRGVTKDKARLDRWAKELAPSGDLRKWFDHVPERFGAFRTRYRKELAGHPDDLRDLRERASAGRVTIVYAARDVEHNNAVVLRELLAE